MNRLRSSKDRALVYFLVRHFGRKLGRTRLIKALYLADVYAVEQGADRLSSYSFYYHRHGPFATKIYGDVEALEQAGIVRERRTLWRLGPVSSYEVAEEAPELLGLLSDIDVALLSAAGKRASELPMEQLLDEVYSTPPMMLAKAVGHGTPINIVAERHVRKTRILPSRERVHRSIQELEAGQGKDAMDVLHALRARHIPNR